MGIIRKKANFSALVCEIVVSLFTMRDSQDFGEPESPFVRYGENK